LKSGLPSSGTELFELSKGGHLFYLSRKEKLVFVKAFPPGPKGAQLVGKNSPYEKRRKRSERSWEGKEKPWNRVSRGRIPFPRIKELLV